MEHVVSEHLWNEASLVQSASNLIDIYGFTI